MKLRRDSDSGILVPQRERIWTPHRGRQLRIVGPNFFAPSGPSGPASVSLMRFEDAGGLLIDTASLRSNTWVADGSPSLDTSTPMWGAKCLSIDAVDVYEDIYTTGANFKAAAATPFTAEGWIYPLTHGTAIGSVGAFFRHAFFCLSDAYPVTPTTSTIWLWWVNAGTPTIGIQNAGGDGGVCSVTPSAWSHWHISFDGTNLHVGANGTRYKNLDFSGGYQFNTIWLGNMGQPGAIGDGQWDSRLWTGKLDSFRLVVGTALYTGATYTVPSTDFADI